MDYQATLYHPIFTIQGVPGVLHLDDGIQVLTVLDKTSGVDLAAIEWRDRSGVEVQTVRPAAVVRVKELRDKGISLNSLIGKTIAINEAVWKIESYRLRPSPKGQNDGEAYLILWDVELAESESE